MNLGTINLTSLGDLREVKSRKDDSIFYAFTSYIDLGAPYPDKCDFLVFDRTDCLAKGDWIVPLEARVFNGKFYVRPDFKKAQPVIAKPATTATNTTTTAKAS